MTINRKKNEKIKNFIFYMIESITLWQALYIQAIQIDSFKTHINSVRSFMMFVSSKNLRCSTLSKWIFRIKRKQFSRMLISSSSTWFYLSFTIFMMQHYINWRLLSLHNWKWTFLWISQTNEYQSKTHRKLTYLWKRVFLFES